MSVTEIFPENPHQGDFLCHHFLSYSLPLLLKYAWHVQLFIQSLISPTKL